MEGFKVKTDLSKAVIYQIYLRTFTAEGTLKAAEKMIPHLSELGIDIIYLSACNKEDTAEEGQSTRQIASGMNNVKNPYRITDFFAIDEEYGTMKDLIDFVNTSHRYGLKVLFDLVYAHCGYNAVFGNIHPEFFKRNDEGEIIGISESWPFAGLNYESYELREYMWSNMEFYVRDVKVDGFRCDVGDRIPLDFWVEGVRRIKEINPDVIMLNEGDDIDYFKAFDAEYTLVAIRLLNNVFLNPENSLKNIRHQNKSPLTKIDATAKDLKEVLDNLYKTVPEDKYILCNSENHDTVSDFYNERPEMLLGSNAAQAIMALVFTLKGIPMIYNGCEVADSIEKCMFWNRFCTGSMSIQWQNALTEKGRKRLAFVKKCIELHKNEAICHGEFLWIEHDNEENVLCYERKNAEKSIVIAVNVTAKPQRVVFKDSIIVNVLLSQNTNISGKKAEMAPYGFFVAERG